MFIAASDFSAVEEEIKNLQHQYNEYENLKMLKENFERGGEIILVKDDLPILIEAIDDKLSTLRNILTKRINTCTTR